MQYQEQREQILSYVQQGCRDGLLRLSAGNFSLRFGNDLVAITPSSILYQEMKTEEISIIDLGGKLIDGPRPSSETPMHTAIYREVPRARSICHTHSIYAMVCAMAGDEVPLMSIELMTCGAPIPVAPWATPGTARAGEVAVNIFNSREKLQVMLLRQHGLVAIGGTLPQAYASALNAETGMEVYYKTKLLGKAQPFSPQQEGEIREVYRV
jgi:L-ribulose-5-phosphate 4-epimerase